MQGHELRGIRKRLGLSGAGFGARLGMARETVSLMENDRAPIELRTALAARFLAQEGRVDVPRLKVRVSDVEWIPGETQIHTTLADFKIDLAPETKGRWSITLRHRSGYSPPWPRWENSLEDAKASAILHVQLGMMDVAELAAQADAGA